LKIPVPPAAQEERGRRQAHTVRSRRATRTTTTSPVPVKLAANAGAGTFASFANGEFSCAKTTGARAVTVATVAGSGLKPA
jgi:hypothetical protein